MERFVIIVNGFQTLTIITKRSMLDAAAVLDPPLPFIVTNELFVSFISILSNISACLVNLISFLLIFFPMFLFVFLLAAMKASQKILICFGMSYLLDVVSS